MLFEEIPGNNNTKKELLNTVLKNRISQSILFSGKKGSAKLALAVAYAQLLNCEKRPENDSCGICASCLKYNNLSHPDLHLVFPIWKIKGKPPVSDGLVHIWRDFFMRNNYAGINEWVDFYGSENKTNHLGKIYKDEAENIHKKIVLKNFEAKYRVVLIWMPEQMEQKTSNKLLKILEEPPKRTVFILVSESPEELLPTISSRLQKFTSTDFTSEDLVGYFSEEKITLEKARYLKKITNGDLGKMIQNIKENVKEEYLLEDYKSWTRLCYKLDVFGASEFSNTISSKGRKHQKLFLAYSIKMVRESMIYNFADNKLMQSNEKEKEFVINFSPFLHEENIELIIDKLERSVKEINRNANTKILFFELSLQMMRFLKVKRKFTVK